ncbi:toxin-antitoxin system YwqK family antitoxin [Piscinibacter sp.]|uniref:toxin-antitoxin system YwqK family antitoxin n=1 Tax=Piscinibacter sp. TaxID=1903157 RepID=UPI0039E5A71A
MRILPALLLAAAPPAHAIQTCELDGAHVNPANGHTTAGKSGLMRCKDAGSGVLQREQELRDGRFVGAVRFYRNGVLEREHAVNERGNRDGLAREYAATPGANNPLLREETLRNGSTVGLARAWYANGTLRRASFHGDDGREQAVAEFNERGQLAELRCAARPQLAPAADDAAWCGHRGAPAPVSLYDGRGALAGTRVFERGELRRRESYWDDGKPRESAEISTSGGGERSFARDGVKRRETLWVWQAGAGDAAKRRLTTLEREFHDSGTLLRERRWTPGERGAELAAEKRWYLNGQPREASEYIVEGGKTIRRDLHFHDNGQPSHDGRWLLAGRYEQQPLGIHRSFDEAGRLRAERHDDERGRITRERELDAAGAVVRDDAVFEDGSRKAFSR